MARGERGGEMNSRFIRTHIDLLLLYQQYLHPHAVMPHTPPIRDPEALDWKTFISQVIGNPQWHLSVCSSLNSGNFLVGERGKKRGGEAIKQAKLL